MIINTIQGSLDLDLNYSLGALWIKLGWVTVSILWFYVLCRLILDIVGMIYSFKYTNKELVDLNAKQYL